MSHDFFSSRGSMRAVVYKGNQVMGVEEVEKAKIEHPNDIVIDVTTSGICRSDLYMYEERASLKPGTIFGHENMGIVSEVGDGVSTLEEGDRVVIPFNISCGFCQNCEKGFTAFCTNVNPGFAGGAYGYVAMGTYPGGQAEKMRVPYGEHNALKLPKGDQHENAFALLSDTFPTGWHSTELADLQPGESVVIYGAGPVGLMAAYSAKIKGANEIYVVDQVPSRLELAEDHCDAHAIDFSEGDPVDQIMEEHGGMVDKGIDAVGYQATELEGVHSDTEDGTYNPAKKNPAVVINNLIRIVRPTGQLGIPGLYVPGVPSAPDDKVAQGRVGIDFGKLVEKGLKFEAGQCNVKKYNRYLRDIIIEGRADPSWIVSHRVSLDRAPEMYDRYSSGESQLIKVLISPQSRGIMTKVIRAGSLREVTNKFISSGDFSRNSNHYTTIFVKAILDVESLSKNDQRTFEKLRRSIRREKLDESQINHLTKELANVHVKRLNTKLEEPISEEKVDLLAQKIKEGFSKY